MRTANAVFANLREKLEPAELARRIVSRLAADFRDYKPGASFITAIEYQGPPWSMNQMIEALPFLPCSANDGQTKLIVPYYDEHDLFVRYEECRGVVVQTSPILKPILTYLLPTAGVLSVLMTKNFVDALVRVLGKEYPDYQFMAEPQGFNSVGVGDYKFKLKTQEEVHDTKLEEITEFAALANKIIQFLGQ